MANNPPTDAVTALRAAHKELCYAMRHVALSERSRDQAETMADRADAFRTRNMAANVAYQFLRSYGDALTDVLAASPPEDAPAVDAVGVLRECRPFVAYAYDQGIIGAEDAGRRLDDVLNGATADARVGASAGDQAAPTAPVSNAGFVRPVNPAGSATIAAAPTPAPAVDGGDAVREADLCFEAALAEGWLDALADGNIEAIRDLWQRRISWARTHITAALAAAPAPAAAPMGYLDRPPFGSTAPTTIVSDENALALPPGRYPLYLHAPAPAVDREALNVPALLHAIATFADGLEGVSFGGRPILEVIADAIAEKTGAAYGLIPGVNACCTDAPDCGCENVRLPPPARRSAQPVEDAERAELEAWRKGEGERIELVHRLTARIRELEAAQPQATPREPAEDAGECRRRIVGYWNCACEACAAEKVASRIGTHPDAAAADKPEGVDAGAGQADAGAKYAELIYAVGNKYPGESRHETALRYIRQAEAPNDACAARDSHTDKGSEG